MLIAHLSDPHVCAPGTLYQGVVDSNAMLKEAVRHVCRLSPAPDLVLISGDLTEHGAPEEYAHVRELLSLLPQRLLAIPGNHDEREAFRAAFADHDHLPAAGPLNFSVTLGSMRMIGLDVTIPNQHHGVMSEAHAAWLDGELAHDPERPTLVMMHQPPFASGIGFIDDYRCHGGERLAAIVSRYPCVERVLCGHVHRAMQLRFGGTLLTIAPSTATAIALRLAKDAAPASYLEPPGLLLHHWTPERGTITHHVLIGAFPGPMPFF